MTEWIRLIIAMVSITAGVLFAILAVIGTYRFNFVLNRMHTAAMIDTCALLFNIIGLIVLSGFTFTSLKLALIVIFLWFASPVASHLISSLVIKTHESDVKKVCEYINIEDED